MKVLLAAINAKYIHSNLGVYSLKAYAEAKGLSDRGKSTVEIREYAINHEMDRILQDVYKRKPDFVGFSCYIWNISYIRQIVRDLAEVLPETVIWLGGPEASYDAETILREEPAVTGVMTGEGEGTFEELIRCYEEGRDVESVRGLVIRTDKGLVRSTGNRSLLPLDEIPFPYVGLEGMEHRILYYESSRGCPYSCSYCLSSVDRTVRFRSLELVKRELSFFLENRAPQVKFVDRTFNCSRNHCQEIWQYLLDHDNGVTNFHFEISADLITDDQLEILRQMRPGLIQLEIGVQTVNPKTVREICRTMDLERLQRTVRAVRGFSNIHQHLDLIAGLPYEDFDSFRRSFDHVYRMRPDQLQLGFLKVLKGSPMAVLAPEYELKYHREPPYEVLSTRWLSYGQILELKKVEEMTEVYYNSSQFSNTLQEMELHCLSPFELFRSIGDYYERKGLDRISHNRLARYEILFDFLKEREPERLERYRDLLMYDLYLRENLKSRPRFARDQNPYKTAVRNFFTEERKNPRYLRAYGESDFRQMAKTAHVEVMGDGKMVLFDYRSRDPRTNNGLAVEVGRIKME